MHIVKGFRGVARVILTGAVLVLAQPAFADDEKKADESCVSQCDEASDKCMNAAGKDKDKRASCDKGYEDCLAKCG